MTTNLYINTAKYYDIGNEIIKYDYDIDFYKSFIGKDTKILEIGCGTGRITLPLAKEASSIVAMDLSKVMLDILREKISKYNIDNIKVLEGNMTDFSLKEKFDLIIFPGLVFQSLRSNDERKKCLNIVYNHLNKDGKVIIDMFDPNPKGLNNLNNERFDFEYYDDELGLTVKKYSVQVNHDESNQTIASKHIYRFLDDQELVKEIEDGFELGYLYYNEAKDLFKSSGFEVINSYRDYDFNSIDDNNKLMLIYVLSKSEDK